MNYLAKYHNDINDISFKGFTERDMNIVMALIANVRDAQTKCITFKYSELKKIMGFEHKHITNEEFRMELLGMQEKLIRLFCRLETKDAYISFVLFPTFILPKQDDILTVAVNETFAYLLNNLTNYTYFRLQRFVGLNSKYSKTLYRKLCQWRRTGRYTVGVEEFRELFCVPENYTTGRIMEKIILPSVRELANTGEDFKCLKCVPHYLKQRGKPVSSFEFIWEPEPEAEKEYTEEQLQEYNVI